LKNQNTGGKRNEKFNDSHFDSLGSEVPRTLSTREGDQYGKEAGNKEDILQEKCCTGYMVVCTPASVEIRGCDSHRTRGKCFDDVVVRKGWRERKVMNNEKHQKVGVYYLCRYIRLGRPPPRTEATR
jgi:hypothetical protein